MSGSLMPPRVRGRAVGRRVGGHQALDIASAGLGDDWYILQMATWDVDAETTHPLDFRLVRNSFVTMFWRSSLLNETVDQLRSNGYRATEFDAGSWFSDSDM
jgi:hypothetical protein